MIERPYKFNVRVEKRLADFYTPIAVYQNVRSVFSNSFLLESADYRGSENSFSFICCKPLAGIKVSEGKIDTTLPDGSNVSCDIKNKADVRKYFKSFISAFSANNEKGSAPEIVNGFFGYMSFDSIQYFEDISFKNECEPGRTVYDLYYNFYKYIIAFNHFKNEIYLIVNTLDGEKFNDEEFSQLSALISQKPVQPEKFSLLWQESTNFTDAELKGVIAKCKQNIARGDVFQIVISRRYSQGFSGDDFNLYRALRAVNPSPYLFYFDCGDFRLMGSSPEAQLVIKSKKASIFAIAGTYPRSADRSDDQELAESLKADPKESAEHVMLVDLARNDLSKHCRNVGVETFKEVQFYSHVIHLVSKISGYVNDSDSSLDILADTFPAGTLSGAPKYRALELIDQYEKGSRSFYAGCLGHLGLNGDVNHAIMIRSFLSKNSQLFYQAGAGIVFDSDAEKEVQEIKSKLGALRKAVDFADKELV